MLSEKLLIVDDNPEVRKLIRLALGYGKYLIYETGDGEQALALARSEKPDVIVMDIMMPGLDGIAVCQVIKADPELSHSYIVLLTALGQERDITRGLAAGADTYMIKPFSPGKLIEIVENRVRLPRPIRAYGYDIPPLPKTN